MGWNSHFEVLIKSEKSVSAVKCSVRCWRWNPPMQLRFWHTLARRQRTLAINAFEFAIPSPAKDKLSLPVAAAEYPAPIYPPPDQTPCPTSRVKALSVNTSAEHILSARCKKATCKSDILYQARRFNHSIHAKHACAGCNKNKRVTLGWIEFVLCVMPRQFKGSQYTRGCLYHLAPIQRSPGQALGPAECSLYCLMFFAALALIVMAKGVHLYGWILIICCFIPFFNPHVPRGVWDCILPSRTIIRKYCSQQKKSANWLPGLKLSFTLGPRTEEENAISRSHAREFLKLLLDFYIYFALIIYVQIQMMVFPS